MSQTEIQLYLPTTLDTKVNLRAFEIDDRLENNIKRVVEKKYGNKFFNFGYVRPGTIRILKRSIGNKIGTSDFTGDMSFNVIFQCEVYLPQIGQEIDARVKSINKIGIMAKSDSNKLTILLSKPHQSNLELFSEVMLESRVRIKILDFKIDSQNETIMIIGDLVRILSGVYQNYQMPRLDGMVIDLTGDIQLTSNIRNLYINYDNYVESINSKSLMDPYAMFVPETIDNKKIDDKTWDKIRQKPSWLGYKDYWSKVRSMVEDYELVHASGGYNGNKGIAKLALKSQPISRAFFKLWELLYRYPEIIKRLNYEHDLTILNLGESPGGFIQSLNHYRFKENSKTNDTYYAYSLQGDSGLKWENEMVKKEFGKFDNKINLRYVDITKSEDIEKICNEMKDKKADLITGDAAFTLSKIYNYEEIVNYKILFGEIVTALLNQKVGGSFVLKIFDTLTYVTRQLLIILNNYYSEIFITKPDFSRPASSEKYVICLGFKGVDTMEQDIDSLKKTCYELLNVWNEKVVENMNIYYPKNENFLLNLLGYNIGEDNDFSKKLQDITRDHVIKQSEHINRGIHLIHTKNIFDKRKVEQIKQNQIKQAINWCQRYKLEYNEDIDLTMEKFVENEVINTSRMIKFSITDLFDKSTDYKESFDYMNNEYPNVNMEYLLERSMALNQILEKIYQDFQESQIYEFKVSRLDPISALNGELTFKDGPKTQQWYEMYELLNNLSVIDKKSKTLKCFVNLDTNNADIIKAISYYVTNKTSANFDWIGNVVWREDMPDPSEWYEKNKDKYLMGDTKDKVSGNVGEVETLEYFMKYFGDNDKKVNLYVSNFNVPLSEDVYGVLILNPERYFMREYYGQIISGLFSLKDGGQMLIRQYTFFEKETVVMIALLEELFNEVTIVKPLIGQMEVFLFADGFKMKKFTEQMKKDLLVYMSEAFTDSREDMMNRDYVIRPIPDSLNFMTTKTNKKESINEPEKKKGKKTKETKENEDGEKKKEDGEKNKDDIDIVKRLVYIGYRIYVLNQFPRLQVNLDLYHNVKYQLNSQEEASIKHLLGEKEAIMNKMELSSDDKNELINMNKKMEGVFSDVTEKIVKQDFRYILQETVTNWLEQNNPLK